jgi:hypothetical protein
LWSNMTDLVRRSYLWRTDGPIYCVKPLTRHIVADVPTEATHLVIDRPDSESWSCLAADRIDAHAPTAVVPQRALELCARHRRIVLRRVGNDALPPGNQIFGGLSPKLAVRRLLTEVRDRLCLS